jgi:hypothetical protein
VNITRKAAAATARKRSLHTNESEEVMPAEQAETSEAVRSAAVPISIEIDAMIAALPGGADLTEIAFDLINELEARCDCRDFIAIFKEALLARRTLIELGVDLSS